MFLLDIEVEILVNGKPVKKFSHEGQTFVQANKGSLYSIRIKNSSWNHRLFVCSVDGINVINGQAAGASKAGYVIGGYTSYEVAGFRTSNDEVHPFRFNDKSRSYAAKSYETKGDTNNCGVIGVMVYDEINRPRSASQPMDEASYSYKVERTYPSESLMGSIGSCDMSFCGNVTACASSPEPITPSFNAGTEFSKQAITDKVSDTQFDIGTLYTSMDIFYAYRDDLIKMGVPVVKEAKIAMPCSFPAKFCKPPEY